jgi:glycosyltransferase involved in cell wall biosynthesis
VSDRDPLHSTSETLVSVVLPTHLSAPPFISEAVISVIDQTWGFWELIVVDDGSPDPDSLVAQVSIDSRVRVVRSTRGGVARARNLGLTHALGSLVAFLDHDDVWYPEHLSKAVHTLANNPAAVAAFSSMEVLRGAGRGSDHIIGAAPVDRHSVLTGRRPSLNTMVIRREPLEEVGGFDPRYDGADDLDLIYKLVSRGLYAYVDAVTVFYRVHDDNWSRDVRSMAISGDEVRRDHLRRAKWSGDAEAVSDLRAATRSARRYYAGVALGDAVGAARAGQARPAAAMAWWALRYSPAGVTEAVGKVVARRWRRERGQDGARGAPGVSHPGSSGGRTGVHDR